MVCEHRKVKKNFPFGRKSIATKYCKSCGKIVTNKMIKDKKMKGGRNKRNGRKNTR